MSCYRDGGCGPYEMYSCNECPASKPEYKNRSVQATSTPVATNYDRLIRMTPEELALWMHNTEEQAAYIGTAESKESWLDWLKQEVTE